MSNRQGFMLAFGAVVPFKVEKVVIYEVLKYDPDTGKPYKKKRVEKKEVYPGFLQTLIDDLEKHREEGPGDEDDWYLDNAIPTTSEESPQLIWPHRIPYFDEYFVGAFLFQVSEPVSESMDGSRRLDSLSSEQEQSIRDFLTSNGVLDEDIGYFIVDSSEW